MHQEGVGIPITVPWHSHLSCVVIECTLTEEHPKCAILKFVDGCTTDIEQVVLMEQPTETCYWQTFTDCYQSQFALAISSTQIDGMLRCYPFAKGFPQTRTYILFSTAEPSWSGSSLARHHSEGKDAALSACSSKGLWKYF